MSVQPALFIKAGFSWSSTVAFLSAAFFMILWMTLVSSRPKTFSKVSIKVILKVYHFIKVFYVIHWVDQVRDAQVFLPFWHKYKLHLSVGSLKAQKSHLSLQNFSEARMHTSRLCTAAIKCVPAATVAIWWQPVGGGEDESCQWQPLKRTTHFPVTGETWWMIISRCDRCCNGGGALSVSLPFCPPSLCLPLPPLVYLGQCFNTLLTWLYWHTPDSVWWLMSAWVPILLSLPHSLSVSFSFCSSSPCYSLFTVRAVQFSLSHSQSH